MQSRKSTKNPGSFATPIEIANPLKALEKAKKKINKLIREKEEYQNAWIEIHNDKLRIIEKVNILTLIVEGNRSTIQLANSNTEYWREKYEKIKKELEDKSKNNADFNIRIKNFIESHGLLGFKKDEKSICEACARKGRCPLKNIPAEFRASVCLSFKPIKDGHNNAEKSIKVCRPKKKEIIKLFCINPGEGTELILHETYTTSGKAFMCEDGYMVYEIIELDNNKKKAERFIEYK